jgi:glycosyltransferase involved in cell wall biosynthesis
MNQGLIIINATATKHGGALTILKGFLSIILREEESSMYYIFSGADLDEFASDKIKIINKATNGVGFGGVKRLIWDILGLRLYCKFQNLHPDKIVSFQNTGVLFPKVKQIIYYHQLISLMDFSWRFYRKNEAVLYFYKNIYPFFIRFFINENTEFIVQQEFIKKLFSKKFRVDQRRIHVVVPSINLKFNFKIKPVVLESEVYHMFYPANSAKYKNHRVLFDALYIIRNTNPPIFKIITLHLTLDPENRKTIPDSDISGHVHFLGKITYEEVISYYHSVNLLVFPSYIETFGLPMLEAASVGLPMLVSDLEYSHEALSGYPGASYVKYDDPVAWANAIITSATVRKKYIPFRYERANNSWSTMKGIIENSTFEKK